MPENNDAADRAAAEAEKLTGGLFKNIHPREPETDEGTFGQRLCVGQLIVMIDSGLSALFGLFGLFAIFGFLGWMGVYGIVLLIFAIINLALLAFMFYSTFEVRSKKRRTMASLQIVLAALMFALGFIEAIILSIVPLGSGWLGYGVHYGGYGIGSAFINIFWYGVIVGGALLTMANPQLTLSKLFGGASAPAASGTPAAPPAPAAPPTIPETNIYVNKGGTTLGPFDRITFNTKLTAGEFSNEDLVYATNNQWIPIKNLI